MDWQAPAPTILKIGKTVPKILRRSTKFSFKHLITSPVSCKYKLVMLWKFNRVLLRINALQSIFNQKLKLDYIAETLLCKIIKTTRWAVSPVPSTSAVYCDLGTIWLFEENISALQLCWMCLQIFTTNKDFQKITMFRWKVQCEYDKNKDTEHIIHE